MADQASRSAWAIDEVDRWLFSEAMTSLLELLRCEPPSDEAATAAPPRLRAGPETPPWLAKLLELEAEYGASALSRPLRLLERAIEIERQAARQFDFRSPDGPPYRERTSAVPDLDESARFNIEQLTSALGFIHPVPTQYPAYDKTLVLGGGFRSPLLRARYAALLEGRGIRLGELYFLGSPRFLITNGPPERLVTETYAPAATDEFDLMVASSQAEFRLVASHVTFLCGCSSSDSICTRWRHDANDVGDVPPPYTHERSLDLLDADGHRRGSIISASTSRPPYRPSTSDTLALWVRLAAPNPGQRVLIVTSQLFVPFQRFEHLRRLYLPYGVEIDAVGFDAEWHNRAQSSENLLQAALSAIRSAKQLLMAAIKILHHMQFEDRSS